MMRLPVLALALAALLLSAAGPAAAGADDSLRAAERRALFAALGAATSEPEGRAAEDAIWRFWMQAPDAEAQALLDKALERRRWYDFAGALVYLDRLVADYPDYAEGWNQRATIHFLREEYDLSLADIEQVLKLEPKHFGALAGRAVILLRQGKTGLGQLALIQALAIDPWLRERSLLTGEGEAL